MLTVDLPSPAATRRLGRALAHALTPPALVTLAGDLGTGKTTLVRHILHARGVVGEVVSPSFTIAQSYQGADGRPLHHLDLYRLTAGADTDLFAWDDYLSADAVVFVEWPEAGRHVLPEPDVCIELEHVSLTARAARIRATPAVEERLRASLGALVRPAADAGRPVGRQARGGRRP